MIVTLLTDFGGKDEYVGVMKGVILGINPSVTVVDLCHEIPLGDIPRAGRLLSWSWPYFPKGTIHVVVVDPGVGSSRKILCLKHRGHLFLAPDNGVLSQLLAGVRHPHLVEVTNRRFSLPRVSNTFHGRDIFAPAAAYLSKGLQPSRLGRRIATFKQLPVPIPKKLGHRILQGEVIQIDRFGNAVTNLPAAEIQRLSRSAPLKVEVNGHSLCGIQPSYSFKPQGAALAVIGSHDLLEIAVNQGSAADRLRIRPGSRVKVTGAAPRP